MDRRAALFDKRRMIVAPFALRRRWPSRLPLAALALAAVVQLLAFWPGVMVWDSIHQYQEAVAGRYADWHPPAMAWLWRRLAGLARGPAPMLVVQAALYWAGFALLVVGAARTGRVRLVWAIAACAVLPVPFLLMGTILKDSLMAAALIGATGLIAVRPVEGRWRGASAGGFAAALLIGAATLRFNAVPACLPLVAALAPAGWRRRPGRLAAMLAIAAAVLAAALPLANRALDARRSGVELSLIVYDLGGITRFAQADALPPVPVADAGAVAARCWSPVSWDSYSWWVDKPCPVGFAQVSAAFAARGGGATGWWLRAIAAHPVAYAQHRLAHVACNLRLSPCGGRLPGLSLRSDPNPFGYQIRGGVLTDAVDAVAAASLATPLGWPVCWLALALACLIVRPFGPGLGPPLAWSAALYALSYVPLSVASEVRYHLWTMIAAALAAVLTLAAAREEQAVARWRWWAAGALVGIVTTAATLTRLV